MTCLSAVNVETRKRERGFAHNVLPINLICRKGQGTYRSLRVAVIPLLIQMPFFIGFFFALREMVELRHSELGIWADLSAPDPYFVLPALFCVVMILTQRLNPQPAGMDPTQAQVMKYMPVMFSVLFIFFPAALCLYTVVNSAVQLAQQTYLYKQQGALNTD